MQIWLWHPCWSPPVAPHHLEHQAKLLWVKYRDLCGLRPIFTASLPTTPPTMCLALHIPCTICSYWVMMFFTCIFTYNGRVFCLVLVFFFLLPGMGFFSPFPTCFLKSCMNSKISSNVTSSRKISVLFRVTCLLFPPLLVNFPYCSNDYLF